MKVSKLIHDLHEQLEENKSAIDECVFLRNENEGFLEEIKEHKKENALLKKECEQHIWVNDELKKENIDLRKNQDYVGLNRQITDLKIALTKFRKENVRLVAQLENDEHNVGHLDEKMKRLDYLEKVFASNRYVFTDIPNTPENLKMV